MEDINEVIKELTEYMELDGTELGEVCSHLISVHGYPDYIGKDFLKALKQELRGQLENFKSKCKIVEREETYTRTYRELDWWP